ncbi:MAG: S8 family serine peptidase, partial [Candidatus Competibacteraceae bacterium]|nr:S8 family serine peptidase [Candidatus Competibacteraceae bacterium]
LAVDEPALGRWLAGDPAAGSVLLELPRTAVARAVANLAPDGFDPLTAAKLATLKAVESLNRDPAVKWAEPNYLARASFIPPDRLYPRQWHYPLINLPQAWDLTQGRRFDNGQPVIVAVLDTGIVSDHPDLRGQTVGGYDFISDPVRARDGDGIDPNPEDPGDLSEPDGSSSFHGTHVAGIVVARAANSATVEGERVAAFGVVGSAFAARVMPLRVLGRLGEGTFFDIEQAIRYAAGLPNSSGTVPSRRADVINLSLGSIAFSASLQETLDQARAAGVVAVAAAGNSGTGAVEYPAAFKGVMSVAAVGQDRRRAPYSTFNRFVDVAAPGGDMSRDLDGDGRSDGILSTWTDDGQGTLRNDFTYFQGTSMATPHMAGVAALMLAANPRLTPGDIDALLAAGAISDDLGDNGRDDEYGFGLIDAFEAVASAIEARGGIVPDPLPLLSASPPGLNFALNRATIDLKVSASGAELRVAPPVSDAFWLRISPLAVEETGLGEYRVTVERSALEDGLYTSEIIFTAQEQTLRIPVIMQVSRNLSNQDLGPQYVLLVDPDSDEVFSSVRARRQDDGSYRYRFDQVPQGQYQIFAGSDLDNNGIVCEAAEACGAFRTLDLPQRLEISGNRDDLDFDGSFTAALPGSTTLGSLALPTEKALPR